MEMLLVCAMTVRLVSGAVLMTSVPVLQGPAPSLRVLWGLIKSLQQNV
jgi:hypothetical protein